MTSKIPRLSWVVALCIAASGAPRYAQSQAVDIYYDAHMIPHVFGETDAAAFYGLGYQHMRDNPLGTLERLWRFTGRFAEVVGPSYLDDDYLHRLWELPTIAAAHRARLSGDIRAVLDAYVQGIEDARAWWHDAASPPSSGTRLRMLLGTESDPANVELNVDPLPDFLHQGFHPFEFLPDGDRNSVHPGYDPADVPQYIRRVIDRLFDTSDPTTAITIDHVLTHAIALNSGPERLFKAPARRGVPAATNAWLISATAAGGSPMTLNDPHSVRDTLKSRPYFVQVHGDQYRLSGYTMPGLPIYVGYSDFVSWVMAGSSSNESVTGSTWEVRLHPAEPLRFRFGASSGDGKYARLGGTLEPGSSYSVKTQRLHRVADSFTYFDVVGSADLDADGELDPGEVVLQNQVRDRFYVRDGAGLGFPNDRYPVTTAGGEDVDGIFTVPQPGDAITFEQASFTTMPSLWEFFVRLGRARQVDNAPGGQEDVLSILNDVHWAWDNNLLFADYTGRFFHAYVARVPRLGPGAARFADGDLSRISMGEVHLDGGLPMDRWTGFYSFSELPQIGPVSVTAAEAWICNTVTPDLIEVGPSGASPLDDRLTGADLGSYPREILRPLTISGWRQVRAQELLQQDNLSAGALNGLNEAIALDRADPWIRAMWPFFRQVRDIKAAELVPSDPDYAALLPVGRFIDWVEAHRNLAPDGLTYDPAYDFDAHALSLVTPYTSLLRSWYENLLDLQSLTPLQESFGDDPLHPLYALGPTSFVRPSFDPNIEAMWQALIGGANAQPGVVPLWSAGTGPTGLQNHDFLVTTGAVAPWVSEPRYDDLQTTVDLSFAADIGGDRVLRWGHVNVMVMTPHFIPPAKASLFDAAPDRIRAYLYAGLRPDLLAGVDPGDGDPLIRRFKFPVFQNQGVLAYPIGGTSDSLFVTKSQPIFVGSPQGADQGLYRWNPDDRYLFVPHEQGSEALLSVELRNPPDARGRFIQNHGGTEITTLDFGAYQDRFAPTANFVNGVWHDLITDETTLSATSVQQIGLTYTP